MWAVGEAPLQDVASGRAGDPGGTHDEHGTASIVAWPPQVSPCLPPRPQTVAVRPGRQPGREARRGSHRGLPGARQSIGPPACPGVASAPLQSQPQTAGPGQGCGSRWPEASVTPRGGLTQVKVRTHAHACTSMHTRRARTGTYTRTLPRPAERRAHCTAKLSLGGATASGSRGSPGSPEWASGSKRSRGACGRGSEVGREAGPPLS